MLELLPFIDNNWKESFSDIPSNIQTLYLGDCILNDVEKIDFSCYKNLNSLYIHNHSFQNTKECIVKDLPHLIRLSIGHDSFQAQNQCSFHLQNCPVLNDVTIGDYSMKYYSSCVFESII